MARKRLTPRAAPPETAPEGAPEVKAFGLARTRSAAAPIARVTGESAAEAALATLAGEMETARAEGRLILTLALDEVAEDHLARDRLVLDDAEMAVLMRSLSERGQQTAIDVLDRGETERPRYGLISGYRRMAALRRLSAETGEARFATVRALVRRPDSAAEAYRAMVDENEIRVGLSYWERARITVRAAEIGVYPDVAAALRGLFSAASRAKRSKIGAFVTLDEALGDALRFPAALPERLGLRLAKAVQEDGAERIRAALAAAAPDSAAAEQEVLAAALDGLGNTAPAPAPAPAPDPLPAPKRPAAAPPRPEPQPRARPAPRGLRVERLGPDRLLVVGEIDPALEADLAAWLAERGAG